MICLVELRGLEPLTLCLQSTFALSVTAAGLGLNRLTVRPRRPLSDLVAVSCSGQPDRDRLLRRSFHVPRSTAALLVRAGLLIVRLQLNVSGFRPVLARELARHRLLRPDGMISCR